jgi:hypothetical protein
MAMGASKIASNLFPPVKHACPKRKGIKGLSAMHISQPQQIGVTALGLAAAGGDG